MGKIDRQIDTEREGGRKRDRHGRKLNTMKVNMCRKIFLKKRLEKQIMKKVSKRKRKKEYLINYGRTDV